MKAALTSCLSRISHLRLPIASWASNSSLIGRRALREMRRVLNADGRLALMVWCGIRESLGFAALAEILEVNIGPAAAAIMRAPFGLSDADELTQLVSARGFRDVRIQQRVGTVQFPSIERFVLS